MAKMAGRPDPTEIIRHSTTFMIMAVVASRPWSKSIPITLPVPFFLAYLPSQLSAVV